MPKLFSAAFIFSKTRLAAVFTVEAALLMALILPVLLSLIYLGFLDHDRGVLQGAACEAASLADNSAPDKARADKLRTLTEEIGKDAILVSRRSCMFLPEGWYTHHLLQSCSPNPVRRHCSVLNLP